MKKTLYLLLAALMLLFAGCAPSHQEVMDSIPTLMVLAGNAPAQVPTCGYDWTVTNRWGSSASVIADTAHPLEAQEDLTSVTLTAGETVSLYFSKLPDSVTVTYWSAQETDHENSAQVETAYLNDTFRFTTPEAEGPLVFQITAQWTGYQDVSGTVSYAFTTAAEA